MSNTKGRKAQLFKRAVEEGRKCRSPYERADTAQRKQIKANEVGKMHDKIKSAFRAADAA